MLTSTTFETAQLDRGIFLGSVPRRVVIKVYSLWSYAGSCCIYVHWQLKTSKQTPVITSTFRTPEFLMEPIQPSLRSSRPIRIKMPCNFITLRLRPLPPVDIYAWPQYPPAMQDERLTEELDTETDVSFDAIINEVHSRGHAISMIVIEQNIEGRFQICLSVSDKAAVGELLDPRGQFPVRVVESR